jgi:hypothetical protein
LIYGNIAKEEKTNLPSPDFVPSSGCDRSLFIKTRTVNRIQSAVNYSNCCRKFKAGSNYAITSARIYVLDCFSLRVSGGPKSALAQNEVIVVNGERMTSYDVDQRKLWLNLTNGFGERMKALLTGDEVNRKFREKMLVAQPKSRAEAEEAAARIKKELIEDAKRQVLSEGGATRQAVIEALSRNSLPPSPLSS